MFVRIEPTSNGYCRLVYISQLNLGGNLPAGGVVMGHFLKLSLAVTLKTRHYWQEQRTLAEYDENDGRAIALRLMHTVKSRKGRANVVQEVVLKNRALRELNEEYSWLVGFLEEVVRGKLALNKPVGVKLECLSQKEARRIGHSLPTALRARKTAKAGLFQWQNQNPAMVELFEKHEWAEHMMLGIAQAVLEQAPWGVVWRVSFGAFMSTLDIVSDVYVIVLYLNSEKQSHFASLLGFCIGMSMFMQLVVTWLQNRKRPVVMLKDGLIVLTGLKPAYDAYKVATAKKMEAHHMMDSMNELVFVKASEMVAESIPGCLLQCYAYVQLLESGGGSKQALFSILVSAATCGFASATISYDYDTDPKQRHRDPSFYGYVPDHAKKRTIIFFCMFFNSTLMLLIRGVSAALLMNIKREYWGMYWAGDMFVYLGQKVIRNDMWYWVPLEGWVGVIMSVLIRIVIKIITDFTGVIQFRHAGELGGIYYTFNMFLGMACR